MWANTDKFSHSGERSIRFFLAAGVVLRSLRRHVCLRWYPKYFLSSRVSSSSNDTPLPDPSTPPPHAAGPPRYLYPVETTTCSGYLSRSGRRGGEDNAKGGWVV